MTRAERSGSWPRGTCSFCGSYLRVKIPRGGDGSVSWPHRHKEPRRSGLLESERGACPGSFEPIKEDS